MFPLLLFLVYLVANAPAFILQSKKSNIYRKSVEKSQISMVSFFQMNKAMNSPTEVLIESPSMNSRRITAGIIVDATQEDIWRILTDYNNLATHVPNLVQSYLVPNNQKAIRLFQEGAQKIIGFDFRASLTMDMREDDNLDEEGKSTRPKRLFFKLIDSSMFSSFDGEWIVKTHSRSKQIDPVTNKMVYKYKSLLMYTVYVRPKGPVPVMALEWRIKEDVPLNLAAMKEAAENLAKSSKGAKPIPVPAREEVEWEANETLGMYINSK